jgi:hypothetical protein
MHSTEDVSKHSGSSGEGRHQDRDAHGVRHGTDRDRI